MHFGHELCLNKKWVFRLPVGPVVKNPLCNAGHSPWLGNQDPTWCRAAKPECCNYWVSMPQLESLWATAKNPTWWNQDPTWCRKIKIFLRLYFLKWVFFLIAKKGNSVTATESIPGLHTILKYKSISQK